MNRIARSAVCPSPFSGCCIFSYEHNLLPSSLFARRNYRTWSQEEGTADTRIVFYGIIYDATNRKAMCNHGSSFKLARRGSLMNILPSQLHSKEKRGGRLARRRARSSPCENRHFLIYYLVAARQSQGWHFAARMECEWQNLRTNKCSHEQTRQWRAWISPRTRPPRTA